MRFRSHLTARAATAGTAVVVVLAWAAAAAAQPGPRAGGDKDVMIPALGFSLAASVTVPPSAPGTKHPAIILVPGSGPVDRNATVAGIPIFGQLADGLTKAGFLVVRYDKRGVGNSGGRDERATLEDYAGDTRAVFDWLEKRKDVDRKRISVVGHSEGGAVGMIAAAREEDIASLVLLAASGTVGSELILEQQRRVLDLMKTGEEERKAKIDLQQRIQTAVLTGVGWQGIPPDVRKRADTPWFKSFLEFDPAKWMPRVKQPVLIVQGELDTQVPPHHADKLAAFAQARKKAPRTEVTRLPSVNHLLVRATTGEVTEYATLPDKTIVPEVAARIAAFLGTLRAR